MAEFSYKTDRGEPLCWPLTPYWDESRGIISVSTGVAYPNKAWLAKRNPKVAIYFSDRSATDGEGNRLLVIGDAKVLDADIQQNTDRYVKELRDKFPVAKIAVNPITVQLLDFYLPRLWIEVTPVSTVVNPSFTTEPAAHSDPPAPSISAQEADALIRLTRRLGEAVVTSVMPDGYPMSVRMGTLGRTDGSLALEHEAPAGPCCLTFHTHSLGGTRFHAWMARGAVHHDQGETIFTPRRIVGFFGNGAVFPLSLIPRIAGLRRNAREELARLGQSAPKLRIPR